MNNKEKVDKGFEIFYYNLSYRRRFYRNVWISVIAIPLYFIPVELNLKNIIFGIVMVAGLSAGLVYNYKKWKQEEKQNKQ